MTSLTVRRIVHTEKFLGARVKALSGEPGRGLITGRISASASWRIVATFGEGELVEVTEAVRGFIGRFGLAADPSTRLAEFGCGEGYVGRLLAEAGFDYTGFDLAPSALAKAQQRLTGMADPLLAAPESFDAAVDIMTLHMLVVDRDRRNTAPRV